MTGHHKHRNAYFVKVQLKQVNRCEMFNLRNTEEQEQEHQSQEEEDEEDKTNTFPL